MAGVFCALAAEGGEGRAVYRAGRWARPPWNMGREGRWGPAWLAGCAEVGSTRKAVLLPRHPLVFLPWRGTLPFVVGLAFCSLTAEFFHFRPPDSSGIMDSWSRKKKKQKRKGPWGWSVSAGPQSPPKWRERGRGSARVHFRAPAPPPSPKVL